MAWPRERLGRATCNEGCAFQAGFGRRLVGRRGEAEGPRTRQPELLGLQLQPPGSRLQPKALQEVLRSPPARVLRVSPARLVGICSRATCQNGGRFSQSLGAVVAQAHRGGTLGHHGTGCGESGSEVGDAWRKAQLGWSRKARVREGRGVSTKIHIYITCWRVGVMRMHIDLCLACLV